MTDMDDPISERAARAARIRADMGGAEKVAALHAEGHKTIRDHIDAFLDPGSFRELGTFSRSMREADRATTPG
ncbi:MAG: methylmalonyl-CoA carboxyltransferase, partial [Acidimicrobiia bacterium]|nr:methylmalonyl-CoA carboxyltransferase [Acidimicrobiia bacterium]